MFGFFQKSHIDKKIEPPTDITQAIHKLFAVMYQLRDSYITLYAEKERPTVAAWWRLHDAGERLDHIIEDIGLDRQLVMAARRIQTYHRGRFSCLCKDEHRKIEPLIVAAHTELSTKFPGIAEILVQSLGVDSPADGNLRRGDGFISRCFLALSSGDDSHMSCEDGLDALNLSIELMLGRQFSIPMPDFPPLLLKAHKLKQEAENKMRYMIEYIASLTMHEHISTLGIGSAGLASMLENVFKACTPLLSEEDQESLSRTYTQAQHLIKEHKKIYEQILTEAPEVDVQTHPMALDRDEISEIHDAILDLIPDSLPPDTVSLKRISAQILAIFLQPFESEMIETQIAFEHSRAANFTPILSDITEGELLAKQASQICQSCPGSDGPVPVMPLTELTPLDNLLRKRWVRI